MPSEAGVEHLSAAQKLVEAQSVDHNIVHGNVVRQETPSAWPYLYITSPTLRYESTCIAVVLQ